MRRSSKVESVVGEPIENDSSSRREFKYESELVENETGSQRESKDEPFENGSLDSRRGSKISNIPSTPLIEEVSTPKSPAASIRRSSNISSPKSPMLNGGSVTGNKIFVGVIY